MLIEYSGPHRAVEIADTGLVAVNGEPIDVPDSIANGLLEQPDNWKVAKAPTTTNRGGQ